MSDQLALDLEVAVRPVRVETSAARPVFTVSQFVEGSRLSLDEARAYLETWCALGVVERTSGGWSLTAWGKGVALDLAQCAGRAGEE